MKVTLKLYEIVIVSVRADLQPKRFKRHNALCDVYCVSTSLCQLFLFCGITWCQDFIHYLVLHRRQNFSRTGSEGVDEHILSWLDVIDGTDISHWTCRDLHWLYCLWRFCDLQILVSVVPTFTGGPVTCRD